MTATPTDNRLTNFPPYFYSSQNIHEGLKEGASKYFAEDLSIYATEVCGPVELALSPAACDSNPRLDKVCSFAAGPMLSSSPPAAGAQGPYAITRLFSLMKSTTTKAGTGGNLLTTRCLGR